MRGFFCFLTMLLVSPLALATTDRVALVIGNAKYQHTTTLANPVNDARDIAAALRTAGFAVEPVVENADKARLQAALAAFADKAHGARQALVYYAGHGIEAAGENYLVPVDAPLRNERTVSLEAVKLSDVLAVVSSAGQLGLVVLDACRDNPLAARMQRIDATRSATRGLGAPGEPGGNLMVVYAAEAGRVAADGAGRNSPFTQAVLGALNAPPMEVRQFWGHVRDQVSRSTGGAQRPFTYGSLGGEAIYLAGSGSEISTPQWNPGPRPMPPTPAQEALSHTWVWWVSCGVLALLLAFQAWRKTSFHPAPAANGRMPIPRLSLSAADGGLLGTVAAGQSCIVGRDTSQADISMPDKDVRISLRHLKVSLDAEGQAWVEDLESSNGVWRGPGDRIPVGRRVPIELPCRLFLGGSHAPLSIERG